VKRAEDQQAEEDLSLSSDPQLPAMIGDILSLFVSNQYFLAFEAVLLSSERLLDTSVLESVMFCRSVDGVH
jgi:hypothetical protein